MFFTKNPKPKKKLFGGGVGVGDGGRLGKSAG